MRYRGHEPLSELSPRPTFPGAFASTRTSDTKEVNPVSESRPRINPRHRTIDVERLAAAILDLAALVEGDENELEIGTQIHARLTRPEEKSA